MDKPVKGEKGNAEERVSATGGVGRSRADSPAEVERLRGIDPEARAPLNTILGMTDLLWETTLTSEQRNYVQILRASVQTLLGVMAERSEHAPTEVPGAGGPDTEGVQVQRDGATLDLKGIRVLLADDKPVDRTLLQRLLSAAGASVTEVQNGQQAVGVLEASNASGDTYDILFLASRLPRRSGLDVVEHIRKGSSYDGSVILMSTPDHRRDDRLRAEALGCFWMVKPISPSALKEVVQPVADGVRSRRQGEPASGVMPLEALPPLHILLVEDSPDDRFLVQAYLKHTSCSIDMAEDGRSAVELFKTEQYDLVLMDLELPIMDGVSTTRWIREWETGQGRSSVPVIALTVHASREDNTRCFEAGCTAYLTKPVRKATLLKAIARYACKGEDMGNLEKEQEDIAQVDPELEDLIPGFMANRQKDIQCIRESLEGGDFKTIGRLGHSMKGAGAAYGFDKVTDIGKWLESAAKEGDSEEIRKGLDELATYLGRVKVVLVDPEA